MCMKFYGIWTNRLDFPGNPDLERDTGIFLKEFYHCAIGSCKGSLFRAMTTGLRKTVVGETSAMLDSLLLV